MQLKPLRQSYDHRTIEAKWQRVWEEREDFRAEDFSDKPKTYLLVEFPYPSGEGLHVGHARSYAALDALARKRRLQGQNVLFPMGFDAFGLPTENYAIKTGSHPRTATDQNIVNYRRQLKSLGLSFDWSREVDTTDPRYYRWTQWIFLQLFKRGLAYQATIPINWCPSCKIGLANEEVVAGACERCGTAVTRKMQKQWMLKITAYAERLLSDLDTVDYPERIKTQQVNWIGRSEGALVGFRVQGSGDRVEVFTTRPDTLFGATYLVLSPEHPLIENYELRITNYKEVKKYIDRAVKKSDLDRTDLAKEKTGVELKGLKAVNPANNEPIPIWVADSVLATYGTGAIMAVPAHDERDYEFAKKYRLPIRKVIQPPSVIPKSAYEHAVGAAAGVLSADLEARCWIGDGTMVNSGPYDGLDNREAGRQIVAELKQRGFGKPAVQYKLRDWVFSRQHYWGEPIPIIHCPEHGPVPVPEDQLPVELPHVDKYQPTGTGESPLAVITDWVNTACPQCGKPARRETDTMPNWAGSSWYFLRYTDPHNNQAFADRKKLDYWLPVDVYNGGMEHTVLHLLYSRFWYKFLYDEGFVPTAEPYAKRRSHGIVLAEDGRKMSKSFGNVINPDAVIKEYGADTLRIFEMFLGPFEDAIPWSTRGIIGVRRFLERVWRLQSKTLEQAAVPRPLAELLHRTIKKVGDDLENFRFNTAVSSLMILANALETEARLNRDVFRSFLQLLLPFAPHLAEELLERADGPRPPRTDRWPGFDPALLQSATVTVAIQVAGRRRDAIELSPAASEAEAVAAALQRPAVTRHLPRQPSRVVYVPGKILNLIP